MLQMDRLDHLVLTVRDIDATCDFYARALGMEIVTFGEKRQALKFGRQKINLHQAGRAFHPKAHNPGPGTADLCFVTRCPIADVVDHLTRQGIAIESGPVIRTGALGPIQSVYIRDPDKNLLEIANY